MSEVKAGQVWKYNDDSTVTVVSVRKATAREAKDMGRQFAASHRAGFDSDGKVVLYREDGDTLVETMTLGGFLRQFHQ